jgi:hypothetical protein
MPAEQTLPRQRCWAVGRGIQHHLDHAFDPRIDRIERADVYTQPAGDGRTHGFDVELLALDLAGLDHVLSQCCQTRLITQGHAHVGQTARQQPLARLTSAMGPSSAARSKRQFGQSPACQMYW